MNIAEAILIILELSKKIDILEEKIDEIKNIVSSQTSEIENNN